MSAMTVCRFPRYCLVIFRPKITVILVGWADGPIGVQQPFSHPIQRAAAAEDEVIAKLYLGEKQAMLATRLPTFPFGEKRPRHGQPLLTAAQ
jgi:hypothetical protein